MSICKRGHIIEYTPGSDSCRQCKKQLYLEHKARILAKKKADYAADPKKYNDKNKAWAVLNRDKTRAAVIRHYYRDIEVSRAKSRMVYANNKLRHQSYCQAWSDRNPEKVWASSAKRRSIKKEAMPSWLGWLDKILIQEKYALCQAITMQTGIKHEIDHVVPLYGDTVRGLHVPWNLQIIPEYANRSKGNKLQL